MTIQAASLTALTPDEAVTTARSILDAGYEGIILENPVHQDAWRALLPLLPKESVKAMRLFLPCRRRPRPGSISAYEVATENPGDREDTLREARKTLEAADQVGSPIILLPITQLSEPGLSWDYRPPTLAPDPSEQQQRAASEEAHQRRDSLLILLSQLLEHAERYALTICLTPSNRSGELPIAEEALACMREFEGAALGLWLDTTRLPAEFLRVPSIGGPRSEALEEDWLAAVQGAFLHDQGPALESCTPGQGSVPWELISSALHNLPVWSVPAGHYDALAEGLHFMAGLKEKPEEPGGLLGI